jgi:YHS domain-containing protein
MVDDNGKAGCQVGYGGDVYYFSTWEAEATWAA